MLENGGDCVQLKGEPAFINSEGHFCFWAYKYEREYRSWPCSFYKNFLSVLVWLLSIQTVNDVIQVQRACVFILGGKERHRPPVIIEYQDWWEWDKQRKKYETQYAARFVYIFFLLSHLSWNVVWCGSGDVAAECDSKHMDVVVSPNNSFDCLLLRARHWMIVAK